MTDETVGWAVVSCCVCCGPCLDAPLARTRRRRRRDLLPLPDPEEEQDEEQEEESRASDEDITEEEDAEEAAAALTPNDLFFAELSPNDSISFRERDVRLSSAQATRWRNSSYDPDETMARFFILSTRTRVFSFATASLNSRWRLESLKCFPSYKVLLLLLFFLPFIMIVVCLCALSCPSLSLLLTAPVVRGGRRTALAAVNGKCSMERSERAIAFCKPPFFNYIYYSF